MVSALPGGDMHGDAQASTFYARSLSWYVVRNDLVKKLNHEDRLTNHLHHPTSAETILVFTSHRHAHRDASVQQLAHSAVRNKYNFTPSHNTASYTPCLHVRIAGESSSQSVGEKGWSLGCTRLA